MALRSSDLLAERVAYSVAEAAFITGLSGDLLYSQMRAGELAYLKVGRHRIITRRNLEAFLARTASLTRMRSSCLEPPLRRESR